MLWVVSLVTLFLVLFGEYGTISGIEPMNKTSRILYVAFSKILWSLAIGFVIYACVNSYGGIINDFLSYSLWIPLSKLSFCAYLVQYSVIDTYFYTQDHPLHVQLSSFVSIQLIVSRFILKLLFFISAFKLKIYLCIGNTVISYILAYFCALLFEMPFMALERIIFK